MKVRLYVFFGAILVALLAVTSWATSKASLWDTLVNLRDPWFVATLFDAYGGFLTFYAWTWYKETRAWKKLVWFVLIMTLGNIAMSIYVIRETFRLGPDDTVADLLTRRNR